MIVNLKAMFGRKKPEIIKDKNGNIFCSPTSICPEEADIFEVPRTLNEKDYIEIINKLLNLNELKNIKHVESELLSKVGIKEFLKSYKEANEQRNKDTKTLYTSKKSITPQRLAVLPGKSKFRDKLVNLSGE